MSGVIQCTSCKRMSAHPQKTIKTQTISWSTPDGYLDNYFTEYSCSNCGADFARILDASKYFISGHETNTGSVSDVFTYNSPSNSRGIGFRGTQNYSGSGVYDRDAKIKSNRRKKTAGIADIKSKRQVVTKCESFSITQIDLQLEEEEAK